MKHNQCGEKLFTFLTRFLSLSARHKENRVSDAPWALHARRAAPAMKTIIRTADAKNRQKPGANPRPVNKEKHPAIPTPTH
ncbi:hypothetical protein [Chromobacterium haemolyticum]|uniref:hypothetical protein n=1 Tax=Chromobacterium haemolyticum TaxID=394935 RepID=UPI0011B27704|nr:hypothetical protein [Chromobacterium haemolyticum]